MCLVLGHALEAQRIRPCTALDLVQRGDNGGGRDLLVLWNLGVIVLGEVVGEDVLEVAPVVDGVGVEPRGQLVAHGIGVVLTRALANRPVAHGHLHLMVAARVGHSVSVHARLCAHLCVAIPVLLHLRLGGTMYASRATSLFADVESQERI